MVEGLFAFDVLLKNDGIIIMSWLVPVFTMFEPLKNLKVKNKLC